MNSEGEKEILEEESDEEEEQNREAEGVTLYNTVH